MGIYAIKPRFQKTLAPVVRWCIRTKISPTFLNLAGLVSAIALACALYFSVSFPLLLIAVPVLGFVRTALNALDGLVARELSVSDKKGELMNEFLDRVSDALIFSVFALLPAVMGIAATAAVALILLSSYLGIFGKVMGGPRVYAGPMGKADRMMYLGAYTLLVLIRPDIFLWNYFLIFMCVGMTATIIARWQTLTKDSFAK